MSKFVPHSYLHEVLPNYSISTKTDTESHHIYVNVYGEHSFLETTCNMFLRFKSGDFDLSNKDHGKPPEKFQDAELHTLLDGN